MSHLTQVDAWSIESANRQNPRKNRDGLGGFADPPGASRSYLSSTQQAVQQRKGEEGDCPLLESILFFEVGHRQIFSNRLEVSAACWWMKMESELVWVGDEGTTEASGGLSFETIWRLSGDLQFCHIGTHPLNEDGSFEAPPCTLADLFLKYRFSDSWEGMVTIQNLFDAEALEAQTYFESQLREEPRPAGDNHFNPAYPFTFRLVVQYNF